MSDALRANQVCNSLSAQRRGASVPGTRSVLSTSVLVTDTRLQGVQRPLRNRGLPVYARERFVNCPRLSFFAGGYRHLAYLANSCPFGRRAKNAAGNDTLTVRYDTPAVA